MISDHLRFFRLRAYLGATRKTDRHRDERARPRGAVRREMAHEGLEGGILEAFGKLFPTTPTSMFIPRAARARNEMIMLDNVPVPRASGNDSLAFSRRTAAGDDRTWDADHPSTPSNSRRRGGAWGRFERGTRRRGRLLGYDSRNRTRRHSGWTVRHEAPVRRTHPGAAPPTPNLVQIADIVISDYTSCNGLIRSSCNRSLPGNDTYVQPPSVDS